MHITSHKLVSKLPTSVRGYYSSVQLSMQPSDLHNKHTSSYQKHTKPHINFALLPYLRPTLLNSNKILLMCSILTLHTHTEAHVLMQESVNKQNQQASQKTPLASVNTWLRLCEISLTPHSSQFIYGKCKPAVLYMMQYMAITSIILHLQALGIFTIGKFEILYPLPRHTQKHTIFMMIEVIHNNRLLMMIPLKFNC